MRYALIWSFWEFFGGNLGQVSLSTGGGEIFDFNICLTLDQSYNLKLWTYAHVQ